MNFHNAPILLWFGSIFKEAQAEHCGEEANGATNL
jgi:hypothetical protein